MKTNFKESKGITLIALVITIIVLLILAGVSIAMLTGQNGILTQAQKSQTQTEIGEEKEQIGLAYNGAVTEKQSTDVTSDDLNKQFELNGVTDATASGDDPITVTFESGNQYTIENGVITGPIEANIVATMRIEGTKVTEPPVPEGFTHTEGTIDDGFVIQDENGNEFVWVPVDKDQKIKINVTSKEDIESITLTDPYGDNIALSDTDNLGTSYTNDNITPTINGPYVLNVKTTSDTKTIMLGVHSLYAVDTMRDWDSDNMLEEIDEQIKQMEEEASQQGYSSVEEYANAMLQQQGQPTLEEMGFSTVKDYMMSMMLADPSMKDYSDTEDYTESVNTNGGFYIGRYEASVSGETVEVKGNVRPRNSISQENALKYSNSMYPNSGFTSSLLTGAAWDRTLGWLEETGEVTSFEIVGDSKTWGNYSDDSFSNTTRLNNTGAFAETQKNHIYDLAGNLREWTTEADSTSNRVNRGRFLQRQWL